MVVLTRLDEMWVDGTLDRLLVSTAYCPGKAIRCRCQTHSPPTSIIRCVYKYIVGAVRSAAFNSITLRPFPDQGLCFSTCRGGEFITCHLQNIQLIASDPDAGRSLAVTEQTRRQWRVSDICISFKKNWTQLFFHSNHEKTSQRLYKYRIGLSYRKSCESCTA